MDAQSLHDVVKLVNYTEHDQTYDGNSDARFFKVGAFFKRVRQQRSRV